MEQEAVIQAILQTLNVVGWQPRTEGGPKFVVYVARHRQTGQIFISRGPASQAYDVVVYLAERCGLELEDRWDGRVERWRGG